MTGYLAGNGLPGLNRVGVWLNDPSNYWGPDGLVVRIRDHLLYTLVIVAIALLIALPLGLWVGHTGRGIVLVAGTANALRAVPVLGFIVFLVVLMSDHLPGNDSAIGFIPIGALRYFIPVAISLVVLAIPPILTNTYAGVQSIDPAARDAAKGMGMTGLQIVRKVEFPCALPLIMSGLRSSVLQVIATATVAAVVPALGGLGRYIIDGDQQLSDPQAGYPAMVAAGVVVAILAVLIDALLALVQRLVVSRGISGRYRRVRGATATVTTQASLAEA